MRKTMVVAAGIVLALGPTGTAFAGETGQGKALGNCQNSSAGGHRAPVADSPHGIGNGGLRHLALPGGGCAQPVVEETWRERKAEDFG